MHIFPFLFFLSFFLCFFSAAIYNGHQPPRNPAHSQSVLFFPTISTQLPALGIWHYQLRVRLSPLSSSAVSRYRDYCSCAKGPPVPPLPTALPATYSILLHHSLPPHRKPVPSTIHHHPSIHHNHPLLPPPPPSPPSANRFTPAVSIVQPSICLVRTRAPRHSSSRHRLFRPARL